MIHTPNITTKEQAVIFGLLEGICNRQWAVGDLLPSEPAQVRQFGVSRVTVRRALNRLREHGVISARHGVGSRVVCEPTPESARALLETAGRGLPLRVKRKVLSRPTYRLAFRDSSPPDDHVFLHLRKGIVEAAAERGHEVTLQPLDLGAPVAEESDVDGLILHSFDPIREEDVEALASLGCPYVLLDPMQINNAVSLDVSMACQQAIRVLAHAGHRGIAVIEKHWRPGMQRYREFACRKMADELPRVRIGFYCGLHPFEDWRRAGNGETGLYVNDDVYAVELCRGMKARGLRPGRDLDMIVQTEKGFDPGLPPMIGRVEFDLVHWGAVAVRSLEAMRDKSEAAMPPLRISGRYIPATK